MSVIHYNIESDKIQLQNNLVKMSGGAIAHLINL
jgi:hypothetical protein